VDGTDYDLNGKKKVEGIDEQVKVKVPVVKAWDGRN